MGWCTQRVHKPYPLANSCTGKKRKQIEVYCVHSQGFTMDTVLGHQLRHRISGPSSF